MPIANGESPKIQRWRKNLVQRRISTVVDHLRPQRWNWYGLVRPLDRNLARQAREPLPAGIIQNLRYFWLDGLLSSISEHFYLGYIALFALAYGANNRQVGVLAAVANLLGALALFPGAKLVETIGRRKPVVIWSAGGIGRLSFLGLVSIPFLISDPVLAIVAIIAMDGLRAFMANLANPGWTDLAADLVPQSMRGRFFASRNTAMGLAAFLVAPLAGRIIHMTNTRLDSLYGGYQVAFLSAFIFGLASTLIFRRIQEPAAAETAPHSHHRGDLRRALRQNPSFVGLIVSALVWNMALQVAAPFFNVYLVSEFQATALTIGILASIASFSALVGQRVYARVLDMKGAYWVQTVSGLLIPLAPLSWMFVSAPWQVGIINGFSGFLWAGYNLANFNLLLELTPHEQRPRSVALYQTAVFSSAVVGPLLGGYLADVVGFRFIFGLSAAGRLLGMALFLWLTIRPSKVPELIP